MNAAVIDPCDASQYDTSVAEDQRQEPTELVRYSRWIFLESISSLEDPAQFAAQWYLVSG